MRENAATALSSPFELEIELCLKIENCYCYCQVLSLRELLSNKALHLYLQSRLSMENIKQNVDGKRDDDVALAVTDIIRDERNIAREGFGVLFGGSNSCS